MKKKFTNEKKINIAIRRRMVGPGVYSEHPDIDTEIHDENEDVELITIERTPFKELSWYYRSLLKIWMDSSALEYWKEFRMIPVGEDLIEMQEQVLENLLFRERVYVKHDKDVELLLNHIVSKAINKELRKENKKREYNE